jgi:DNA-binding transcriptional LysR family regulator
MDKIAKGNLAFDLRTLEVFLAVGSTGSMTAAARELGMTQPAVSQIIGRLEAELGAALVDRAVRPLRLTPAGEELGNRAGRLLGEAERAQTAVREVADATLPQVRIGMVDSFAATAGAQLIKALRNYARYLSVWSGISPNLGDDLLHRKLDFVVTTDPMENLGGLERHRLLRERYFLVLPERMAAAIPEVRLEDLARNHPFVRYSARSLIGTQIERHLRRLDIEVPQTLEFDGTEAVFAMVSAGIAWAITTPLCLIHGYREGSGLRAVAMPGPSLSRTFYLLGREGEFGALPGRIVGHARDILGDMVERDIRALAPWAEEGMAVG